MQEQHLYRQQGFQAWQELIIFRKQAEKSKKANPDTDSAAHNKQFSQTQPKSKEGARSPPPHLITTIENQK